MSNGFLRPGFPASVITSPTVTAASKFTSNGSDPSLRIGAWSGLDIPLADCMAGGLDGKAHIAQIFLSGWSSNAFVDNVYFHK